MTRRKSKMIQVLPPTNGHGVTDQAADVQIASVDLRGMFNALDPKEQEAVINFFNLHNAAIWIFTTLSAPAMEYVNLSIKLSQEKVKENV